MQFQNSGLKTYLEYVEKTTEAPRIFHVWSYLVSIGACLGRRCWYQLGRLKIYPNEYCLLVGPPGVRKSDTIGVIEDLMKRATNVRYAPADTGGARQGLIQAMRGDEPEKKDDEDILRLLESGDRLLDLVSKQELNLDDAHTMYVVADEFTTFIGLNSVDMITFLLKVYDGKDYPYRVKNELTILHQPLLSLLGGTNPTAIAQALPAAAIGGGFMSRTVLVYDGKRYKRLARPDFFDKELEQLVCDTLSYVNKKMHGPFQATREAEIALDAEYETDVKINDPRFIYYIERRHSHLIKLVLCCAAARKSMMIEIQDIVEAKAILEMTERSMVDALGEFGLSPVGAAKQKLLEFIQHSSPAPVYMTTINAVMKRDMKTVDLLNALHDLVNAGKIKTVRGEHGDAYVYIDKAKDFNAIFDNILEGALG